MIDAERLEYIRGQFDAEKRCPYGPSVSLYESWLRELLDYCEEVQTEQKGETK